MKKLKPILIPNPLPQDIPSGFFNTDGVWYDIALVDAEAQIVEGDLIYLKSIGKNGQIGIYSYDKENKTQTIKVI